MGVVAAVVAGVAAVGGAMVSANASKKAAQGTANANAKNVADTNEMNYQMFKESRGSEGHAFLPEYTGKAEEQTFNDLYGIYQSGLTPSQREYAAKQVMQSLQPAVQGGTDYLNGVYNGQNLATTRGYYQPLWDSRTQTAQAQADAIQQAYARTRQQNLATNMRQGYYGGSSVQSREAQANMLGAMQQAALVRGAANTQNATEAAQIGVTDLATRQQLLNEPLSRTQSLINYQALPGQAAYGGYDQLAQRLGMFNIGTGQFTNQNAPVLSPNISSGQAAGSAISNLAGTLGSAYINQQQQKAAANQNYNWGATNTYQGNSTPAASNAAQQAQAGSASFWG